MGVMTAKTVLHAAVPRHAMLLFHQAALAACIITMLLMVYSTYSLAMQSTIQIDVLRAAGSAGHVLLGGERAQQPLPCVRNTKYVPSVMEKSWLHGAALLDKTFCEAVTAPQQVAWARIWLDTVKHQRAGKLVTYDPAVFSRFITTTTCPGQRSHQFTTWIEPLAHGLRPQAPCAVGSDLFDREYMLLTSRADVAALRVATVPAGTMPCSNRACQNIYMDLTAAKWESAPSSAGHAWFVR